MEQKLRTGEITPEEIIQEAEKYEDIDKINFIVDFVYFPSLGEGETRADAVKELICDGADHIKQLRYGVETGRLTGDYAEVADMIDGVIAALNRAANKLTDGAFELEGEASGAEVSTAGGKDTTAYSTKRTINRPWADQLKHHQHSDTLVAQTKPDAFLNGVKNEPMAIPVSVITKAQSGKDATHSISDDAIARIPDGMKNAPVVVDNPARNSIVYVTNIEEGGGLVTVSFLKNQTFDGDQVHKATSIHVRTYPVQMLEQLGNDATIYVRKNKLDMMPGSSLLNAGTLNIDIKFIDDSVAHIPEKSNSKFSADTDDGIDFLDYRTKFSRKVDNKETLAFLEKQDTITTYKTMQVYDGKLYPPMAARINGSYEDASLLGEWEQSTEHPELIKNGKFKLDKGKGNGSIEAAYNPYMHSSNLVLNDQFTGAYALDLSIANLTDGSKVAYAKKSVAADSTTWAKIKRATSRSKSPFKQPSDDKISETAPDVKRENADFSFAEENRDGETHFSSSVSPKTVISTKKLTELETLRAENRRLQKRAAKLAKQFEQGKGTLRVEDANKAARTILKNWNSTVEPEKVAGTLLRIGGRFIQSDAEQVLEAWNDIKTDARKTAAKLRSFFASAGGFRFIIFYRFL